MSWVCTNCRKEYADAPADVCATCGSAAVVPADSEEDRPFETARRALESDSPEGGLLNTSPLVGLAFRLVVVATLLVALIVGVALLV